MKLIEIARVIRVIRVIRGKNAGPSSSSEVDARKLLFPVHCDDF